MPIDFSNSWNVPFLPKGGTTAQWTAFLENLTKREIVIEITTDGKTRMKVGNNKTFNNQNYIGEAIITKSGVTTKDFGPIPKGTNAQGKSFQELFETWAYQFVAPIVSNLRYKDPTGFYTNKVLEIGQIVTGTGQLIFNSTETQNIAPSNGGTFSMSPALVNTQSFDAKFVVETQTPFTIPNSHTWKYDQKTTLTLNVLIRDINGGTQSLSVPVKWSPPIWSGSSSLEAITTKAQVEALGTKSLRDSRQGVHNFTGNYSWIIIEKSISINGIGFVDIDINTGADLFSYDMQKMSDITFNNDYINIVCNAYRSVNSFSGATKCRIV